MADDLDDIRSRLDGIAEELADLAIQRLKASIAAGAAKAPADERRISRARRAVEKASALLGQQEGGDGG